MTKESKLWAAAGHLSYLLGLPVVLPLLLYVWKRDSDPFAASQAKQAAGLHLFVVLMCLLGFALMFGTFGIATLIVGPALFLLSGLSLLFSVLAGFRIADGQECRYPLGGDWSARF
jgi:hypothetical protein